MEHHVLPVTKLINALLGKPVLALLNLLGIHPHDPHYPIPNHIAMMVVVFAVAIPAVLWLKRRLSVERPGAVQQCMEMYLSNPMGVGVRDLLEDIAGHGAARYLPMIGTISLFVLLSNLISLIPGFESPTAALPVPLGCALLVFAYYNFCGVRKHGPVKYAAHFLGPVPALAIIMLPIELVSHAARLLSLTVRLWVNMFVSELLYVIFLGLMMGLFLFAREQSVLGYPLVVVPLVGPLIFIALHVFVAFLQAFVFTLLPIIYLGGAVAEEH
jgi:F-type H+-transporting ATPase subunit a